MSEKDFKVSADAEVNSYVVSPAGAVDGQSLVYDGTSYSPYDIVPVGSIEMWAGGSTPPNGWLLCDGTSYSWSAYTRLRDVIGISYGGSIDTSWNVPDLTSSTSFVTPIGRAAGDSLGTATVLFGSASTSHAHNYTSSTYGSNGTTQQDHSHDTGNANNHTHNLATTSWNHSHNTGGPSNTHQHNYLRGNTGNATNNVGHGTHNVENTAHNHKHNLGAVSHGHDHAYNTYTPNVHSHNWNMVSIGSNASGTDHTHTVNKQSIYFIIKY